MELIIRNNSGQPIYDQISGQIKAQILSGALSPGDALPSIRGLAKDLKISVITTKRASHKEIISRAVPKKGRKKARRTRKPSAGQTRRFIPSAAR